MKVRKEVEEHSPSLVPTIVLRLNLLEKTLSGLKGQLECYIPFDENDGPLSSIRELVEHIEKEIEAIRRDLKNIDTKVDG